MRKNLEQYIQHTSFFTKEESFLVIQELENNNSWREYPYNSPKDNICVAENPDIAYYDCRLPENHFVSKMIQDKARVSVDNYINKFIGDMPWFSYWTGNSQAHYIKYPTGTGMDTHCDHVRNQFDGTRKGIPILSLLVSLNDDYDGGELLFFEADIIKPNTGDCLMFPSNFLYPHKVQTVSGGTRYSFVVWIW